VFFNVGGCLLGLMRVCLSDIVSISFLSLSSQSKLQRRVESSASLYIPRTYISPPPKPLQPFLLLTHPHSKLGKKIPPNFFLFPVTHAPRALTCEHDSHKILTYDMDCPAKNQPRMRRNEAEKNTTYFSLWRVGKESKMTSMLQSNW